MKRTWVDTVLALAFVVLLLLVAAPLSNLGYDAGMRVIAIILATIVYLEVGYRRRTTRIVNELSKAMRNAKGE